MVSLAEVQASNSLIASTLPAGLVAVFVGATNGIGETTLKQFAKHTVKPRVHFIGRSQEAGERIASECKALNGEGTYNFIKSDTSLLKNVDDVCRDIKNQEKAVNLLFLSTGTFASSETPESLHLPASLIFYSRNRFVANLLPLLQRATSLRRVVSVFTGTKEGPINLSDIQGRSIPVSKMIQQRGHAASIVTLSLEALAKTAPTVSFIHDFPGPVKTGIGRTMTGPLMGTLRVVFGVVGWVLRNSIPIVESGERHLWESTTAKFPAAEGGEGAQAVKAEGVARGTDGRVGSGVYSVDEAGESAGTQVEQLLAGFRKDGTAEKVWGDTEAEFKRITGGLVGV